MASKFNLNNILKIDTEEDDVKFISSKEVNLNNAMTASNFKLEDGNNLESCVKKVFGFDDIEGSIKTYIDNLFQFNSSSIGKYLQLSPVVQVSSEGSGGGISLLNDMNGIGSFIFEPAELKRGSTYYIKCDGCYSSNQKNDMQYSIKLGDTNILNSGLVEYVDTKEDISVYKFEVYFTVLSEGVNGVVRVTSNMLYNNRDNSNNTIEGNLKENTSLIDLSIPLNFDILFEWSSSDKGNKFNMMTNKGLSICRYF